MMFSSWSMKPTWYHLAAWPMKNSVIARPIAILAMCCFRRALPSGSGLDEEFHLHPGELDHVVVLERVGRSADLLAVDGRSAGALDMRDEVTLRTARQYGHLHAGLAERGEGLVQLELLAGVGAGEQLDGAHRLARLGRRGGGGRGGRAGRSRGGRCGRLGRILVGHARGGSRLAGGL